MIQIERFYATSHLLRRIEERGISIDVAKDVICYHDTKHQQARGKNGGFVYRFEKIVDGRTIVVAAEIKKAECWIMTVFEATE